VSTKTGPPQTVNGKNGKPKPLLGSWLSGFRSDKLVDWRDKPLMNAVFEDLNCGFPIQAGWIIQFESLPQTRFNAGSYLHREPPLLSNNQSHLSRRPQKLDIAEC
jgi:hypothetical protein